MEPTEALRAIETALRLVIRQVLGAKWLRATGAPEETRLDERRQEEVRRRDGAVASNDLLNYTETYHLTGIIIRNWEKFQPVFKDKKRTEAFFGVIEDVRNSVAHSRDLVPFERDLLSGIAGHLRNQVSLFRSDSNASSRYYPLIESIRDGFGREGVRSIGMEDQPYSRVRLDVGDTISFSGQAFDAKGRPVKWFLLRRGSGHAYVFSKDESPLSVAEGDSVTFEYLVTESDVGEGFDIVVRIAADSRYHRTHDYKHAYDDSREFGYSVNPPDED